MYFQKQMRNKIILKLKVILAIFIFYNCSLSDKNLKPLIDEYKLKSYVENFNNDDEELYSNISNKDALNFYRIIFPFLNVLISKLKGHITLDGGLIVNISNILRMVMS